MNFFNKISLYSILVFLSFKSLGQNENIQKKSVLTHKTLKYSSSFDTYYYKGPINFIGNFGVLAYNGAGNQELNFKSPSFYGGLGISYQMLTHTLFVLEANSANFAYNYTPSNNEKINFSAKNNEFNLYSRIYLLSDRITKHQHTMSKNYRKIKLYAMVGLGLSLYKAKVIINDVVELEQKKQHYSFFVPLGLGIHYRYSDKLSFLLELTRKTWYPDALISPYTTGYHATSFKIQYNPWGAKKKRKISLPAPTTPTNFYSPNGVAPNKKRRKEEEGIDNSNDEESNTEEDFGDF